MVLAAIIVSYSVLVSVLLLLMRVTLDFCSVALLDSLVSFISFFLVSLAFLCR